jgi:hypothetical protein
MRIFLLRKGNIMETIGLYSLYVNLILVLITGVYAFLTCRMVREMKLAREVQSDSFLAATLLPIAPNLLKIRISNSGSGNAFNVRAYITLTADDKDFSTTWEQPVFLSGRHEDFHFPSDIDGLKELAAIASKLTVRLEWQNSFKKTKDENFTFDMERLFESWSKSHFIVPIPEISIQLQNIKSELSSIREYLQKQENLRTFHDFNEPANAEKKSIRKKRKP